MPEENKEVTTTTTNSGGESTKETPAPTKIKFRGQELDPEDAEALMEMGAQAYLEKRKQEEKAAEKTPDEEPNITEKTAAEVEKLKRELLRTQTEIQRVRMEDQMATLTNEFKLTREDPELAADIRDLALLQLSKSNERTTLRECFLNQIKKYEKRNLEKTTEKVKEKTETREKTQGAGKGGSTGPDAAPKLTGKDLLNGGVRRSVESRFRENKTRIFK